MQNLVAELYDVTSVMLLDSHRGLPAIGTTIRSDYLAEGRIR
jgi:hypothetical protein